MKKNWVVLFILFLGIPSWAMAEVLLIDSIASQPANTASGLLRPKIGMNMQQVVQKFGEPVSKSAAVGEPPITRWDYSDYSVYFEHNLVLTSVVKR